MKIENNFDEVLRRFSSLRTKEMKKVHEQSLNAGARIIKRKVLKNLNSSGLHKGDTFRDMKSSVGIGKRGLKSYNENEKSINVNIMGKRKGKSYVIRFFGASKETNRKTKTGKNRGFVKKINFFNNMPTREISEAINKQLIKNINKKYNGK